LAKDRTGTAVFFNGKIVTFDPEKALVRAVAVEEGKIVALGDDAEIRKSAPRGARKYDLGGKVVVPGFIDCHTHFIQMGLDSLTIDLSQTRTIDEALSLMKGGAKSMPEGEWVIGTGWKESGWTGGRFITRADLDSVCPKNPTVAHRVCGHLSSVNSRAISLLGICGETPDVEVDSSGNVTGVLMESAVSIAREATCPDKAKKAKGLALAIRKAQSLGVTSIHDNGGPSDFEVYRSAERAGRLGVRVWFNTPTDTVDSRVRLSLSSGIGSEWLKLGGLKIFCDGALGARTAALSEPFADDPKNKGMFVHERKELDEVVARANEADIQLAVHAIGDSGIDVTVNSLKAALAKNPRRDHRHRIEHLELPSRAHLALMRKLKLIASMQPNFIGEWGGTDGMYISRLGKNRASRNNPFKEVLKARVKLVFGSDCMPFSPVYGIHSAVNAPYLAQKIPAVDAFSAYTRDAAYASFEEGIKGTVSEGKCADLVVLSGDPFENPRDIGSMTVLRTIVGGEVVFERSDEKRKKRKAALAHASAD
jgi:predicted amidohydrolase YtcJ